MNLSLIIILNTAGSQTSLRQWNATVDLLSLLGLNGTEIALGIWSVGVWLHLHNILVYPLRIDQDVLLTVLRIWLLRGLLQVLLISLIHALEHLAGAAFLGLHSVGCVALGKISLSLSLLTYLLILKKSLLLFSSTRLLFCRRWTLRIGYLLLLLGGAIAGLHL